MQTKLDKFYNIKITHNNKSKKCFIYDPDNYKAVFQFYPEEKDKYVTTKVGIKLYYREPRFNKCIVLPKINTVKNIPLLKSNLQKAIRRCNVDVAIKSAIAILQLDPIQLLRRLPIIYIEDVCLIDSYPIIIWLMMTEKEHILNINDIDIILSSIKNLTECMKYYDDSFDYTQKYELGHNTLEHDDNLLALYYRTLYGGMKGDIKMLKNSIYYYSENKDQIEKAVYDYINYCELTCDLTILPEAIDFHPFPYIISMIVSKTNLDDSDIKQSIWFSESGVNYRKQSTIDKSKEYLTMVNWSIIKYNLIKLRCYIMNKL